MAAPAPTTRRDFMRGRPLAEAVDRLVTEIEDGAAFGSPDFASGRSAERTASASLISVSRRAMACRFEVMLPAAMSATHAATAALDEIDRLEEQLTVYAESSEVSRINSLAAATPVPVEERLFALFETAMRLTTETGGAFDMAAGALTKAWGFFRGPKRVPAADEIVRVMERVGSQLIVLDRERRTIEFRRPGVEINLGAIGKGYALDRAAEMLRRDWRVPAALLQGGRSSVYAIGAPNGEDVARESPSEIVHAGRVRHERAGWQVAIAHPFIAGEPIANVWLDDAALGTSGATYQFFEAAGRRFGHILDPRNGWPAETGSCVSVIAPTAAEADALSTAFFILGPGAAADYCDRHPDFGAVVVSSRSTDEPLCVSLFGRARESVALESP